MSSQLSAHAITAPTAITRISVSRCSTLPAHRGSARAEKCSTSFSADIAILPSSITGEPAHSPRSSEPARPFHALPLTVHPGQTHDGLRSYRWGPFGEGTGAETLRNPAKGGVSEQIVDLLLGIDRLHALALLPRGTQPENRANPPVSTQRGREPWQLSD